MIDFPNSPAVNQVFTAAGASWKWDGAKWGALGLSGYAPLASPVFTGDPKAPTPSPGDADTSVATTGFVAASFAPLNAPVFTGDARAVTPATADNDTSIATTAYVKAQGYATSPVSVANGGTNKTSWQAGTIAFAASTTALGEDGSNFVWDNTNKRQGIGVSIPADTLHVRTGLNSNVMARMASVLGGPAVGVTFEAANDANSAVVALQLDGNPLLFNPASGGTVAIGNAAPAGTAGGLLVGAPTGSALGPGKINAVEVRANNVVLTSDMELKTDIEPLAGALPLVAAIEPRAFRWKPLPELAPFTGPGGEIFTPQPGPADFTTKLNRGFIVQDVIEALGGAVEDGVDLGGMVAVLWQAVRELLSRVHELEGKPTALESRLT